jgi:tyrosine-protein kinase Etk/Wzc
VTTSKNYFLEDFNIIKILSLIKKNKKIILILMVIFLAIAKLYIAISTPLFESSVAIQIKNNQKSSAFLLMGMDMGGVAGQSSNVSSEISLMKSHDNMLHLAKALHVYLNIRPNLCPIIGGYIFRHRKDQIEISSPWFGMTSYAWGGESLEIGELDCLDAFTNQEFKVKKIDDYTYKIFLKHKQYQGRLGQKENFDNFQINIKKFVGHPGVEFFVTVLSKKKIIDRLGSGIKIEPFDKKATDLLKISVLSADPVFSKRMVDQFISIHIGRKIEEENLKIEKILKYIQSKLPSVEKDLNEKEEKFNTYRRDQKSINLGKQMELILNQVVGVQLKLTELYQKKAELLQNYTPHHTHIKSIDHQIGYLKNELKKLEQESLKLPDLEMGFVGFERHVKVQGELYLDLLKKMQGFELQRAQAESNISIFEQSLVAESPSKPMPLIIYGAAIMLALMTSTSIILIRYILFGYVTNSKSLSSATSLPVVASIFISRSNDPNHIDNITSESIRSLRTSYLLQSFKTNNRVMITGATAGVGKSFLSYNFAKSLAEINKKVLLIDCDLRLGHLKNYFQEKSKAKGLSNFLQNKIQDIPIQKTDIQNFDFISNGDVLNQHQGELFFNIDFSNMLEELSQSYDVVILDTPPLFPMSDALIIGRLCGTNYFVARSNHSKISEVSNGLSYISTSNVNLNGIILNGLHKDLSDDYYNKYYYNEDEKYSFGIIKVIKERLRYLWK